MSGNKIPTYVCLFLTTEVTFKKKEGISCLYVYYRVCVGVCVSEREMHMSGTLCPLHQMIPKQL